LLTVVNPSTSCTSSTSPGQALVDVTSDDVTEGGGGLLSSQVTEQTGCGTADWPWLIEAGEGQRVNITLLDFAHEAHAATTPPGNSAGSLFHHWKSSPESGEFGNGLAASAGRGNSAGTSYARDGRTCKVYATIRDGSGSRSTTICGGRAPVTHVFLSTTSRVEIRLLLPTVKVKAKVNAMSSDLQMPYFLLRYEGLCFFYFYDIFPHFVNN